MQRTALFNPFHYVSATLLIKMVVSTMTILKIQGLHGHGHYL
jgi:hypothetical protein